MTMPLQGVVAATMLLCAPPVGAPSVQMMPMADSHAGHHADSAQAGAAHVHHAAPAAQPDADDAPGHACSVRAACCLGLALPSAALDLAAPEPAQSFASASRLTLNSVIVDGLERPPRLLPV